MNYAIEACGGYYLRWRSGALPTASCALNHTSSNSFALLFWKTDVVVLPKSSGSSQPRRLLN